MELELSRWVYEGIMQQGGVLAIDPAYSQIEGGLERALYRIARSTSDSRTPSGSVSIRSTRRQAVTARSGNSGA